MKLKWTQFSDYLFATGTVVKYKIFKGEYTNEFYLNYGFETKLFHDQLEAIKFADGYESNFR